MIDVSMSGKDDVAGRYAQSPGGDESYGAAYLRRRENRRFEHSLKSLTVLGLVLGGVMTFVAFYKLYLVQAEWIVLYRVFEIVGPLLLLVAIAVPQLLEPVEKVLRAVGSTVGEWILKAILLIVYFLIMTPTGYAIKALSGTAPIFAWRDSPPTELEGWRDKTVNTQVRMTGERDGRRTSLFGVIRFFISRGKILLLPAVIILVAFGVVLYFVKSSALAPFIYTVF